MTASAIFEGTIRHRRFSPVENSFQYRIFFMYLDISELPDLFAPYLLWSVEKPNVASFRRKDHLGDPRMPLDQAVRDLVERRTGSRPNGPIRMLTHLRYFGYCFNPVSIYYCFDREGTRVDTVIAEIHNTPWLEEYPYVLDDALNEHSHRDWRRYRFEKRFHVSPFMDMDIDYDWRFHMPGRSLKVHMMNTRKGRKLFDASLSLKRREISHPSLARVLTAYPAMTAKVTAMIYWQALRLRVKGAPFFTHPSKRRSPAGEITP
ncbi:Hypothetical protein COG3496 [Olavius algarvensis associated proteobacterium Delta 3]|nr:Hypothetical protein COG3496 [Olavius algarvensis associated proteobacterium Delta 3]CAB5149042.1 Hypothetical protein COG3496 [Olavius algarvensis associated proteobacterium Delta 3]